MSQTSDICSGDLNESTKERKKRKKVREQDKKTNFLALGDLIRSSEQKEDMNRGRMAERQTMQFSDCNWTRTQNHLVRKRTKFVLCNLFEINNSEMVQLFLVGRSWNQWFLSKKIFYIHWEIQKKEDVFGDLTRITELTDERKVGS